MRNATSNKISSKAKNVFESACGIMLFVAVTISMGEIVSRVVFKTSIDLFFDFSVWITVWALLFMAGPLLPEGGHIGVDFLRTRFSGKLRWGMEIMIALVTLVYGAFITWGSIQFLQQLYQRQSIFPRSIPILKWIVELCVPIGMFIFTVYALICLIRAVRRKW
ncbi:MAG: TRAP transporter small permease [Thermodesulfobacteriota bacterium]